MVPLTQRIPQVQATVRRVVVLLEVYVASMLLYVDVLRSIVFSWGSFTPCGIACRDVVTGLSVNDQQSYCIDGRERVV